MTCRQCLGIEKFFDQREAAGKLKKYRKSGPPKTTRALIEAIKVRGIVGKTVLDIGGGVGAIQHELLKAGARSSIGVDASSAYIQAVEDEARMQGHADRVRSHHGDFVDIAGDIPPADIVTLDRVICCYHDLEGLVGLSSRRAAGLYGIVYPRDNWAVRATFGLFNFYLWLRRNPFRVFVHSTSTVDGLVQRNGFQQRYYSKTLVWQVAVYER